MKIKVTFSRTSIIDLEAIVEYYYAINKKTASHYYHEIIGQSRKLMRFPQIGRIVPEFEEEYYDKYRECIVENYRIIYRIEGRNVFVVRIVDARRLLTFDFIRDAV